jgi:glycerol uptake facilitator-like aquaporin
MMGEGRLSNIEQGHELAYTDLPGVLAQHVDELQADRVAESLGDFGHPKRVITVDVGIDDGLATTLTGCSLSLGGQLQIDAHQSTYIYWSGDCQCNTIRNMPRAIDVSPPAIDVPNTDRPLACLGLATPPLARRLLAELLGSAFLAALVIGSGIAAQTLSPGDVGLELLENAAATAAGLYTIILMFGPVSGGHFNPVVSLADATFGGIRWRDALAYIPAQIAGCILGAITANGMFSLAAISISSHHRASPAHLFSEAIATAGLLLVIFSLARTKRANTAPAAVGAYIGAAYFFTSSASFANPAISIGRMFSNTFAGIAPASVPGFIVAQLVGGACAILAVRVLYPDLTPDEAAEAIMPHHERSTTGGTISQPAVGG